MLFLLAHTHTRHVDFTSIGQNSGIFLGPLGRHHFLSFLPANGNSKMAQMATPYVEDESGKADLNQNSN
jgi:hypothetical protein